MFEPTGLPGRKEKGGRGKLPHYIFQRKIPEESDCPKFLYQPVTSPMCTYVLGLGDITRGEFVVSISASDVTYVHICWDAFGL